MAALQIRYLGQQPYQSVYQAMRQFTARRNAITPDECWLSEHFPVFTQGLNGRPEHLLAPGDIPVIATDRGGQVTYHGPGQLIVYCLLDIRRLALGIRQLITCLEQSVIDLLKAYGCAGYARADAPGVYVAGSKIAALGLRIKHGCSYHGLSLNVAMDLQPFQRINPCGYSGLPVTQLSELVPDRHFTTGKIGSELLPLLSQHLGYTNTLTVPALPVCLNSEPDHVTSLSQSNPSQNSNKNR